MIVAFLQNQWFKSPERARIIYEKADREDPYRRAKLNKAYLFMGCLTGRRLKAFYDHDIVWENVSPQIASQACGAFPADTEHIQRVLTLYKPEIVLAFGVPARDALKTLWKGKLIVGPHPASRRPGIIEELNGMLLQNQ